MAALAISLALRERTALPAAGAPVITESSDGGSAGDAGLADAKKPLLGAQVRLAEHHAMFGCICLDNLDCC